MFKFKNVYINKNANDYPIAQKIHSYCKENNIECEITNRASSTETEGFKAYAQAKRTLWITVKKIGKFQTCKPSADYQLTLVSGCVGMCEYCYLSTRSGIRPVVKVYANIDEILQRAKDISTENTVFEMSASSDPVPLEPLTGVLSKTVEFFAQNDNMRLRIATKFTDIDSILNIDHKNHTEIRYSINTEHIIKTFEHSTPTLDERLSAVSKLKNAGYSVGFIIAPVILYDGWQKDYENMLKNTAKSIPNGEYTFEIISHRFTTTAKNNILNIFPQTTLDMNEEGRKFKFGQFGYGKFVYEKEQLAQMKEFFKNNIEKYFENAKILYII